MPERDMDETINSDDDFEQIMTALLNAGLVENLEEEVVTNPSET